MQWYSIQIATDSVSMNVCRIANICQQVLAMININSNTHIYRPMKIVFEFISTPENDFLWQYGTLASASISGGIFGLGTCFRSIGHYMGHRTQSTFEVTDYEMNKRYGYKSLSGPLQSMTTFVFELDRNSTQVAVSMQANVVNYFQMNEGILEKKMKKQLRENLTLLKDILETRRM